MYDAYKGTRKPMPEELRQQVPVMKEVLKAMNILIMEKEGYEADDILGTMAKRAEKEGVEVSLVSGDRDLLQIATDVIKIRIPKTKGGKTEIEDYYAKDVEEAYQVTPLQFIELKALMGDTADNIPGVPKVGQKTATELMVTYKSLDGIYEHIEEITKKSIKETLMNNRELADLSLKLATICIDADIPYSLEQANISNMFTKEAYEYFVKLNFKNMLSRFEEVPEDDIQYVFEKSSDITVIDKVFEDCKKSKEVAIYFVAEKSKLYSVSLCYVDNKVYTLFPFLFVTEDYLISKCEELANAFLKDNKKLLVFDLKNCFDYTLCEDVNGYFDIKLAAYLLNPNHKEYGLDDIATEYAGLTIKTYKDIFGKDPFEKVCSEENEDYINFVSMQAVSIKNSYKNLKEKLIEQDMLELYEKIDLPLTLVLHDMEKCGVVVDGNALNEYSKLLGEKIEVLQGRIYDQAGCEFNINSPKQLGEILFERMGLKGGKKTKTGYSTAADVLEKLAVDNPIVADILEYRGLAKLKSTYADGLTEFIDENGRIHSSFNQMITATGRLSSTEPNLQNIPMRTEMGRQIRKVFKAKEGCLLVDADYSQIELRILADYSGDPELIEAYHKGLDIHSITASKVFHVPFEEVTSLQRRNAKAVNFGIVYGISAFGLSQDIQTTQKEAARYMAEYYETYPGIKAHQDKTIAEAKEKGYTVTMFKRRRPMPELASSNFMIRQFGERAAMNAPIQGTAADIIKIAMIEVYNGLKEANLKSKLILQVHDELLIEAYEDELDQVKEILSDRMKNAVKLAVPLDIDLNVGKDWLEAH